MKKKALRSALAFILIALLSLPACVKSTSEESLTVKFLKVGKADAIIITCGGETLVIDAGETDDGAEVLSALSGMDETLVDALIITHYDKDHVGGAAQLVSGTTVKRVIVPAYTSDTEEYLSFIEALENAGITAEELTSSVSFTIGDAKVSVTPPESYDIAGTSDDADNELSLITEVSHGDITMLFMGDAENDRIAQWLESASATGCDLIKMPHHGVYCKQLGSLLEAAEPSYAVICDSDKNPADEETLQLLESAGASVYETKDGDVTAVSDGKTLSLTQS